MTTGIDVSNFFDNAAFTMRMTPGEDPRVSIMDFVMAVTGKNNNCAGEVIRNLKKNTPEFFSEFQKYQFSGASQREQFVLNAPEAIELLMILPGKKAKAFRHEAAVGLLLKIFAGDPTLHELLAKNAVLSNPLKAFLGHMRDVEPIVTASVKLGEGGESEGHDECKHWIAENINSISFATAVCPTCSTPILGVPVTGGLIAVEHIIPGTNYRADVLVRIDEDTHVVIEVAHTHLISAKKMFECKQAGNTVYEVETKEIKRAIMEQRPFSKHVLYTTCTESVVCSCCN
jgi:hypothetical protein